VALTGPKKLLVLLLLVALMVFVALIARWRA
jgi:hypothetical protein